MPAVSRAAFMYDHAIKVVNNILRLLSSRDLRFGLAACLRLGNSCLAVNVTVHEVLHVEGAWVADILSYLSAKDIEALDGDD